MKNLIVIEKYSFIIRLLLLLFKKKNTLIYYFHPYQIDQYQEFINRVDGFEEFRLSHQIEQEITFKANKEALKILKDRDESSVLKFFKEINISDKVLIAFKKYQLKKISYQIRMAFVSKHLNFKFSSKYKIYFFLNNFYGYQYAYEFNKNKDLKLTNFNLINLFSKISSFVSILLFIPFIIISQIIKNGFMFKNSDPKKYKFGFHLNNNIYNRDDFSSNDIFIRSRNDFYLSKILNYDDKDSIYIFSTWNFNKDDRLRNLKELNSRSADVGYEFNNPLNLKILIYMFKTFFKSIIFFSKDIFLKKILLLDIFTILQIQRDILLCEIFCSKYRIENFISRDDFSPIHVIRTIIFEKYNLKNNGLAHSICLNNYTSMLGPYVYFHTYFTQGKFYYENMYKEYWFSKNHINIGPLYGVLVDKSLNNVEKHSTFKKKYGKVKKICFLISSFNSVTCPFDSIVISKCIKDLLKIMETDKELLMFFVPRNENSLEEFFKLFQDFKKYKNRIIIDYYYSTYELMAYCDYLITEETSSSIFEGTLNPNLSILPFNTRGVIDNPLKNYSDIELFNSVNDLYRYFLNLKNSETKFVTNNSSIKKLL